MELVVVGRRAAGPLHGDVIGDDGDRSAVDGPGSTDLAVAGRVGLVLGPLRTGERAELDERARVEDPVQVLTGVGHDVGGEAGHARRAAHLRADPVASAEHLDDRLLVHGVVGAHWRNVAIMSAGMSAAAPSAWILPRTNT